MVASFFPKRVCSPRRMSQSRLPHRPRRRRFVAVASFFFFCQLLAVARAFGGAAAAARKVQRWQRNGVPSFVAAGMVASSSTSGRPHSSTDEATAASSVPPPQKPAPPNKKKVVLPKYPTARGSEVDSRKIVATGAGRQHLTSLRLRHILFLSEGMAQSSLMDLRGAASSSSGGPVSSFEEMARLVSACDATRDGGGEIGWMNVNEGGGGVDLDGASSSSPNNTSEHLDAILPREARERVVHISTKPGDVFMVESSRGYHLIQIVDVMADVRKMATVFSRSRASRQLKPLVARSVEGGTDSQQQQQRQLTYKLETMGCQMNMADSERIEGQLQSLGIRPFDDVDSSAAEGTAEPSNDMNRHPDIVVLNTCSIRDHAEQKVYSYIGPHAKRKRDGEDVTIVVAGCVAQQESELLLRRAPEVDLIMGPQYANRIGDLLEDVSNGNQVVATEASHIMEDSTKPRRQSTVAAWVNVIYGCNERCTFCIVPTTRGVEQSRPEESIVREVAELVDQGYKEVTLLGQNIDAYGRDMIPKRKFSDLIRVVGSVPGLQRLRFVTSHPRYMSLGVVDAIADTPSACESFHIPFQSGSNDVLAAMGRGHTREKYLRIIERIRSRIPEASITADAIVGFPGETEKQFQETLSLMEEVEFDSVNTAAYSPRPNTPAAVWDNQIDDDVKQERLQRINALNKRHASKRRARLVGQVVEILVEERNVRVPTQVMGRTRQNYIVYCDGNIDELQGQLVKVKIDTSSTYYLAGEIVA